MLSAEGVGQQRSRLRTLIGLFEEHKGQWDHGEREEKREGDSDQIPDHTLGLTRCVKDLGVYYTWSGKSPKGFK